VNKFNYTRPKSLSEACRRVAPQAIPKAGGVDVLSRTKRGVLHPELLVDISRLSELRASETTEVFVRIGATTRLAELTDVPYEGVVEAAANAATPQIRNQATVAGNLLQSVRCWYLHDPEVSCLGKGAKGCPARVGRNENHAIFGARECPVVNGSNLAPILCALDAQLVVADPRGEQKKLRLRDFYGTPEQWNDLSRRATRFQLAALPPKSLVAAVEIPRSPLRTAHVEVRHRESFDWAIAMAAAALDVRNGKVASCSIYLGAVAPGPWRAAKAEEVLIGTAPDRDNFEKAADAEIARAQPLSESRYKVKMARHTLVQALVAAAAREANR